MKVLMQINFENSDSKYLNLLCKNLNNFGIYIFVKKYQFKIFLIIILYASKSPTLVQNSLRTQT